MGDVLSLIEKAQDTIDESKAKEMEQKLRKAQFGFDDYLESMNQMKNMGGISKTVNYKGNRMDMGGHRFFSKVPEVNAWWEQMLPMQGAPAADDIMLQRDVPLEKGGPDPQKEDRVMLNRNRVSR